MDYTILINEGQRALLNAAVIVALADNSITSEAREELTLLNDMLTDLPSNERAMPGTIHAFNL